MSSPAVAALSRAGSDERSSCSMHYQGLVQMSGPAVAALSRAGSDEQSSCSSIIKGWFR